MTDNELKFYDPETGKPLHRVPKGEPIPQDTPYGFMRSNGNRGWVDGGTKRAFDQLRDVTYFTREPVAPPLPTEPGLYLDKDGVPVERTGTGEWYAVGTEVPLDGIESHAPFTPATAVPTETWNRLRVLDPEDTRDRVDAYGGVWRYREGLNCWRSGDGAFLYTLEVIDRHYGPLRFADEVSDDECLEAAEKQEAEA